MRTIELQFPVEDESNRSTAQAVREEKEEQAEEEHVEAVAATLGGVPRAQPQDPSKPRKLC